MSKQASIQEWLEKNQKTEGSKSESESDQPEPPFTGKKGQEILNPSKDLPKKRGRKAIPPQWSRIIDMSEVDDDKLEVFEIETDMVDDEPEQISALQKNRQEWSPLFESKAFWEQ